MAAIALNQSNKEVLSERMDFRIVKAESRRASCFAARRNHAVHNMAIVCQEPRLGMLSIQPLRSTYHVFRDYNLDAILCRQVHHLVVAVPIEFAGSNLNDPPHKPVAEGVDPNRSEEHTSELQSLR